MITQDLGRLKNLSRVTKLLYDRARVQLESQLATLRLTVNLGNYCSTLAELLSLDDSAELALFFHRKEAKGSGASTLWLAPSPETPLVWVVRLWTGP